jgi:hypothetical protein
MGGGYRRKEALGYGQWRNDCGRPERVFAGQMPFRRAITERSQQDSSLRTRSGEGCRAPRCPGETCRPAPSSGAYGARQTRGRFHILRRLAALRRHVERPAQAAEDRLFPNIAFMLTPDATPSEYIATRKEVTFR